MGPTGAARIFPWSLYGMGAPVKFHMNGEVINLIPVRAAHTSGDTIIQFEKANVIMIGDFYRNYGYPFIQRHLRRHARRHARGAIDLMNLRTFKWDADPGPRPALYASTPR